MSKLLSREQELALAVLLTRCSSGFKAGTRKEGTKRFTRF